LVSGYAFLSLRLGDGAEARDALGLLRALDPATAWAAPCSSVRQRAIANDADDAGEAGDDPPAYVQATGAAAWARLPTLA
jgi:hypothetical protein